MDAVGWLAHATADAEARGLPQLKPLLEALARSMAALRATDEAFGHPAATGHTEHTVKTDADGDD